MAMGCGRGGNEFVNSQTIIIPSQTCKKILLFLASSGNSPSQRDAGWCGKNIFCRSSCFTVKHVRLLVQIVFLR